MIPPLVLAVLVALAAPLPAQAQAVVPASPATDGAGDTLAGALEGEAAVERLLEVLRDDAARGALVAALEAAEAGHAVAEEAPVEGATVAGGLASLSERLAAGARAEGARLAQGLGGLGRLASRLPEVGPAERRVAAALLATILSTMAVAMAADGVALALARRLRPREGSGAVRRAWAALLALALHGAGLALAWAAGWAMAALLFADAGEPWRSQVLYLNAFLAFGLARLALRAVASPDAATEPALSPLDPATQRTIYRSLRPVAGVIAQGSVFVVPLVHLWAGFAAARPARTLVATVAALVALWAIRRIAGALAAAPTAPPSPPGLPAAEALPALDPIGPPPPTAEPVASPSQAPAAVAEGLGSAWASLWPPLAVALVAYAWFVAVTRPALVGEVVVGGTVLTGAAILLVAAALHLMRRAHRLALPLPAAATAAAPTLKPRADRILAGAGTGLAVLMLLAAPVLAAWGWGWLDLGDIAARPLVRRIAGQAASAALVVLGAALLWAVVASWIDARLARSEALGRDAGRSRTLLALFRNAFTVAVAVLAGMVALSQLGLDIAPLLAGAGVVGLAIGFGAQTLVKDIITGVFIQLEGAIDVGDVVGVAGITGGVEKLTIRSVRLRTMDGATHVIPFSSVTTVTNLTRDFGYHVADLAVGYGQSVPAVRAALEEAFARLLPEPVAVDVEGGLDMQGVAELRGDAVLVRARIRTRPGRQWDVGRRYSEILKEVLDERGIEVPAPGRMLLLQAAPHAAPALADGVPA